MRVCLFTDGLRAAFSTHNGASYTIRRNGKASVCLQGDDASDWRAEFDTADALEDEIMAHLAKIDLIDRYF